MGKWTDNSLFRFLYRLRNSSARYYVSHDRLLAIAILMWGALSVTASYYIRFDFKVPEQQLNNISLVILLVATLKTMVFFLMGAHRANWRYVGVSELKILLYVSIFSSVLLFALASLFTQLHVPRGVIIIDFGLFFLGACAIRLSGRIIREQVVQNYERHRNQLKDTIIVGAGDAGEMLLREIRRNPASTYHVRAFFDDNPIKMGQFIHGLKVVGDTDSIPEYVAINNIEVALIAIPSANREQMNRIYNKLKPLGIPIKTLPPVLETVEGEKLTTRLRDINITDLLGREEIKVERSRIHDLIRDKVVLVTGAGGSIGSEISRQVWKSNPRTLILLDKSENLLFHIHRNLDPHNHHSANMKIVPMLCDLRDRKVLEDAMRKHRPHIVLHAAAHKHVFMQEMNPTECFRNNVGGIRNIVELSHNVGVDKFVLISTDKAVNPTSVMGATKRLCEMYCQAFAVKSPTSFFSVRFGNVLGSEGSVVPIFLEQINNGGPVTVTHPEVKRYFMTIPEAVALVLQATVIGKTGQILMLDMGEPIKIVDLARQLIKIAGKTEDQIPIQFVGLKQGEKLFEKLSCDSECCMATEHPKIMLYTSEFEPDPEEFRETINSWVDKIVLNGSNLNIREIIKSLVGEYDPVMPSANSQLRKFPNDSKLLVLDSRNIQRKVR